MPLESIFIEQRALPKRVISKWPAIKFAVSRTHKVIGRITFLTSSIITINIIKIEGVPWGTKWDNIWFVFFAQPNIIVDNQNNKDKGSVMTKWEVAEKICGYKAKKFKTRIIKNTVMIIFFVLFSFLPKEKLTSLLKVRIVIL